MVLRQGLWIHLKTIYLIQLVKLRACRTEDIHFLLLRWGHLLLEISWAALAVIFVIGEDALPELLAFAYFYLAEIFVDCPDLFVAEDVLGPLSEVARGLNVLCC